MRRQTKRDNGKPPGNDDTLIPNRTGCVVGPGQARLSSREGCGDDLGGKAAWKLSGTRTQTLRVRIHRGYCLASKTERTSSSHPWVGLRNTWGWNRGNDVQTRFFSSSPAFSRFGFLVFFVISFSFFTCPFLLALISSSFLLSFPLPSSAGFLFSVFT